MCMTGSMVSRHGFGNYDGGRIIHECIVPSSRTVINSSQDYDIDVREFLVTSKNEVIMRTLRRDVQKFLKRQFTTHRFGLQHDMSAWEFFTSRTPGAFDFRVRVICQYIKTIITYTPSPELQVMKGERSQTTRDPWLFPDELLVSRKGDCEDISLLLASLFISSGVSAYNVRVAMGKVRESLADGTYVLHDHVWVAYKTEHGKWSIVEPLHWVKNPRAKSPRDASKPQPDAVSIQYEPVFTFNDEHLWSQKEDSNDEDFTRTLRDLASTWSGIDPGFAGTVHQTLLDIALSPEIPGSELSDIHHELTNRFLLGGSYWIPVIGTITLPAIDDVDNFIFTNSPPYNPHDHFDSASITDSCTLLNTRIEAAKKARPKSPSEFIDKLKFAFHAVADFYAHTTYMHFYVKGKALTKQSKPELYEFSQNSNALPGAIYTSGELQLGTNTFPFCPGYIGNSATAVDAMKNTVISGRYAIEDDPQGGGIIETLMNTTLLFGIKLFPESVRNVTKLTKRSPEVRLLPHHDSIAVDEPEGTNALYADKNEYALQFELRRNAAIRHVQTLLYKEFGFKVSDFANPYIRESSPGVLFDGVW